MTTEKTTRMLKKGALLIAMLLILNPAAFSQFKFGVQGGINYNMPFADFDQGLSTKYKIGYNLGATAQFYFTERVGVQSGLLINSKGYHIDVENEYEGADGYEQYTLTYLEMPFNFIVDISMLQIYAGPYFAMGVNGTYDYDYTYTVQGQGEVEESGSEDVAFTDNTTAANYQTAEPYFFPFDVGANVGVGFEIGPVLMRIQYSYMFLNMVPNIDGTDFREDNHLKVNTLSFSAGFLFGDKE